MDPAEKECANLRASTMQPPVQAPAETPHVYIVPEKQIKNAMDMPRWEHSEAYYDLLGFINTICMAVQGKRLTDPAPVSPTCQSLLDILSKLEQLAVQTPPVDQPQRFGNMAYRTWHGKMVEASLDLVASTLPADKKDAAAELVVYLRDSFGNSTRIDYGTGHELAFVLFLMCYYKLSVLTRTDDAAIALKVFDFYLNLCRKLQVTYRMEPAGSHGVWSLDDFQFVPFVWGAAQLAVNAPFEPAHFVEDKVIDEHRRGYMFVSCIDYIRQVKTGHFAEHSNQLWSISAVPAWSKICTGLIKMYQKEVLAKFPVIQHVFFGSLFTLRPVKPGTRLPMCRLGMMAAPASGGAEPGRMAPPPAPFERP